MLLQLNQIRRDGGTQPREYTDSEVIRDYREDMERGDVFPPVKVVYDGESYWLVDGFHRIEAAERLELAAFECEVIQGTQTDAQWMSFGVNGSHGLRRTRLDVQRAITAALQHPMSAGLSDRAIAEHIRCDHKTVGAQRKRAEQSGDIPQNPTRIGSDGRVVHVPQATPTAPVETIAAPEGGWPEPDEHGVYPVELAEPFFQNFKHAQAVIHVLELQPTFYRPNGRAFIANAGLTGVSGCELAMSLGTGIHRSTKEGVIKAAAQRLALHILGCLRDESLLESRRTALYNFLQWAEIQGADRAEAEAELALEDRRRDERFIDLAAEVASGVSQLVRIDDALPKEFDNWGRVVRTMIGFAEEEADQDGRTPRREVLAMIDQVDEFEARFAAIIIAIREYKARQIAA